MSDDSTLAGLRAMITLPGSARADALERWLAAQSDAELAARALARALSAMESAPFKAPGSNADTELVHFLEAERIRFPLDEAAEGSRDPVVQSELWRHASTSALVTGELADLPYVYARNAVRACPTNDAAWSAFRDALYSDHTDLAGDVESWIGAAQRGAVPAELPRRALAAARFVAEDAGWSDDGDLEALARLEAELG